jgi:hypothetical protein
MDCIGGLACMHADDVRAYGVARATIGGAADCPPCHGGVEDKTSNGGYRSIAHDGPT